jgi:hypothetical protein
MFEMFIEDVGGICALMCGTNMMKEISGSGRLPSEAHGLAVVAE